MSALSKEQLAAYRALPVEEKSLFVTFRNNNTLKTAVLLTNDSCWMLNEKQSSSRSDWRGADEFTPSQWLAFLAMHSIEEKKDLNERVKQAILLHPDYSHITTLNVVTTNSSMKIYRKPLIVVDTDKDISKL